MLHFQVTRFSLCLIFLTNLADEPSDETVMLLNFFLYWMYTKSLYDFTTNFYGATTTMKNLAPNHVFNFIHFKQVCHRTFAHFSHLVFLYSNWLLFQVVYGSKVNKLGALWPDIFRSALWHCSQQSSEHNWRIFTLQSHRDNLCRKWSNVTYHNIYQCTSRQSPSSAWWSAQSGYGHTTMSPGWLGKNAHLWSIMKRVCLSFVLHTCSCI